MNSVFENKIKEMENSLQLLKDKYKTEEQYIREKNRQIETEIKIENDKKLRDKQKENDIKLKLEKMKLQNSIEENKNEEDILKCERERLKNYYKFQVKKNQIENEYKLKMDKEKLESKDELEKIQIEIDKSKMDNENEILKMDYNLKKDINQMDKDLDLFKQIADNYKKEEIYKLDTYKEIELKKQKIQNLQKLNLLRAFRNNMVNNNNTQIN
jgi:hypothetical protein